MKQNHVYTFKKLFCQLTDSVHVLNIVQSDDKLEIELKDLCHNIDRMFLGQED